MLLSGVFCQALSAQAGNILKAFVDEQDGHYLIDLNIQISATKQRVIEVMTDYNQLQKLSSSIRSSQILEQRTNYTKLKLVNEACVLFFCQTVNQVQHVQQLDNDYISINVEPLANNLKFSSQLWHFKAINANTTLIRYSADIEPDFWIPPLIGSWILQNRLIEEAKQIILNAEKLANSQAP